MSEEVDEPGFVKAARKVVLKLGKEFVTGFYEGGLKPEDVRFMWANDGEELSIVGFYLEPLGAASIISVVTQKREGTSLVTNYLAHYTYEMEAETA